MEEHLGGHVYCRACNGALTPQCVPAEAEVGDDEALPICADEDIGRPEVAVDEASSVCSIEAVEVGEGGGELFHDRENHAGRHGDLPSLVLSEEALKGLVVPVRDDVEEAFVFDNLMVLDDSRVKEGKKSGQPTL